MNLPINWHKSTCFTNLTAHFSKDSISVLWKWTYSSKTVTLQFLLTWTPYTSLKKKRVSCACLPLRKLNTMFCCYCCCKCGGFEWFYGVVAKVLLWETCTSKKSQIFLKRVFKMVRLRLSILFKRKTWSVRVLLICNFPEVSCFFRWSQKLTITNNI